MKRMIETEIQLLTIHSEHSLVLGIGLCLVILRTAIIRSKNAGAL